MRQFKGLLLDFDGTLVDSLDVLYNVYIDFLSSYNITGTYEEFNYYNGFKLPSIIDSLNIKYNLSNKSDELLQNYYSRLDNLYIKMSPMVGARDLIEYAASKNILIGLVSSANKSNILEWVDKFFPNYFSIIVSGDDVHLGKPSPVPYLTAINKLDLNPPDCLCVEDSVIGIQSIINSGSNPILLDPNDSIFISHPRVKKIKLLSDIIKII